MPSVPLDDVAEVSTNVRALAHGLRRIREDGFPLSSRLIREMHRHLLAGGRGASEAPGAFRRSQNGLGGTRPGNGRLGRSLITLALCSDGVLRGPSLYLSLYLERHRAAYYDLLQRVRTEGA